MLPFAQQPPNQSSSAAPVASASQQVPTDLLQNLLQIQSQMGFVNPQSSVPYNTNLGHGSRPPGPMNVPNFNPLMNGQVGNSILGSAPQAQSLGGFIPQNFMQNLNASAIPINAQLGNLGQGNPAQFLGPNLMNIPRNLNPGSSNFQNGQFGWQNQVQNMNQFGNLALLNPSQVAALAQLMGCANQVAQSVIPQNTAFMGNQPQLSVLQSNGAVQQANFGQKRPVAPQQMQNGSLTPSNAPSSHPQSNQGPNWQGNRGKRHAGQMSNSNNYQNKNFIRNPQREASSGRFHKSQDHHRPNMKANYNFSKENGGKGVESSGPDNFKNQSKGKKRRSLATLYTEKEIQQWREERKKNYPSKANVEKKLADKQANADAVAEEANLRRQQLKEVLAKQVELGFEVPEIPSHYLLDSEQQFHGRERNRKPLNKGRFQKRFDKRGRFDQNNRFDRRRGPEGSDSFRRNERFPKRQRVEGDDSSKAPTTIKKPTLLEKLLSTDIKRDRSRLLQALRFMVNNSFFKDWPEKPLNFPKVIVRDTETEEKPSSSKGKLASIAEGLNSSDGSDNDSDGDNGGCQEEGEITD